jgi:hypothetical protein
VATDTATVTATEFDPHDEKRGGTHRVPPLFSSPPDRSADQARLSCRFRILMMLSRSDSESPPQIP